MTSLAAERMGLEQNVVTKQAGPLAGHTHHWEHLPGPSPLQHLLKAENVLKDGSGCIWIIFKAANDPE